MKAAFLTLGCKVNYYETEKMMSAFKQHGFKVVDFDEQADVYVVNTCSVTNIADRKSRQMLHRAKKKNPDSIIVAVGCYVESGGEELLKDSSIDVAISNRDKEHITEKIICYMQEKNIKPGQEKILDANALDIHLSSEHTRKYIKIQDGCNQFCSYCLIPYVRGAGELRSRAEDDVINEIRRVASQGCHEVVITGIHLSSYGVDWSGEKQFVSLKGQPLVHILEQINDVDGIERIRLGSLEPRIICEEFLEGLKKVTKLCPHFHLSLQSGCDATLKRMNRHYTADEYKEKCDMIRRYYEHPAITTDVIVGFPGETIEEFETTRKFVKEVRLADIHVFKYSVRTGTVAAKMDNQVSPNEKHRRSEKLIEDTKLLRQSYEQYFVGKDEKVLFEETKKIDNKEYLIGHNERYVRIGIPADAAIQNGYEKNKICSVKISKLNLF